MAEREHNRSACTWLIEDKQEVCDFAYTKSARMVLFLVRRQSQSQTVDLLLVLQVPR